MENTEGLPPFTPPSSFPPLPKKEHSKLKKKIIYNVEDWNHQPSFSPKKAYFFISSSSSEDELSNYAAAAPTKKWRPTNICRTPLSRSESDSSLPGLVTPKPSPPPDFVSYSPPPPPQTNVKKQDDTTLTADVSALPKKFSSSTYITLKPQARKPFVNNDNYDNHETIWKTSTTTRQFTTPTAIITSHRQTRTKTIIQPKE